MTKRDLSKVAGVSYLVIFFAAIFANFFVLDSLKSNPIDTVNDKAIFIRLGAMAFIVTAVFDVVVAWALSEIYKTNILTKLSTHFRIIHAVIMSVAVFTLPAVLTLTTDQDISKQVNIFDTIWLIGLFFFGFHLILLSFIIKKPKFIAIFLGIAGFMYIVDTTAHFVLQDYESYADILLALVAIPSILGEMAFALWLLVRGGKE